MKVERLFDGYPQRRSVCGAEGVLILHH
jgi:hypothetical protein